MNETTTDLAPWAQPTAVETDALERLLAGEDVPPRPLGLIPQPGEPVPGIHEAERAMRRLAQVERNLAAIDAQHLEWQTELTDWWTGARRPLERAREWFHTSLEQWAIAVRVRTGAKTVKLTNGEVATRAPSGEGRIIVLDDPKAFIAAAEKEKIEGVVQLKPTVLVTDVRNRFKVKDGGELIDTKSGRVFTAQEVTAMGLRVYDQETTATVKFAVLEPETVQLSYTTMNGETHEVEA